MSTVATPRKLSSVVVVALAVLAVALLLGSLRLGDEGPLFAFLVTAGVLCGRTFAFRFYGSSMSRSMPRQIAGVGIVILFAAAFAAAGYLALSLFETVA